MSITLNPDQQHGHDMIIDFINSKMALFTLGGYAGTGKTTTIGKILETIKDKNIRIAFCAFTGKASQVLSSKINLRAQDYCGTIHGLIYHLIEKRKNVMIWERAQNIDYDLIIVDEASMVDSVVFKDLSSYGVPILAVGDHFQLPPVKGKFNLMEFPEFKLETIVRQAQDNPIIKLATMARETGHIPYGKYGPGVAKVRGMQILKEEESDIVLCATNRTRVNINSYIRSRRGFDQKLPMKGESVICLRNNREAGIYNGMIGTIEGIKHNDVYHEAQIDFGAACQYYSGQIMAAQFGNEKLIDNYMLDSFDWAFCITVHKSQGSEFRKVILIDERMHMMDDDQYRRWIYTGITRAREELIIITK